MPGPPVPRIVLARLGRFPELTYRLRVESTDTQALCGRIGEDVVIAFRGSSSVHDWMLNANARLNSQGMHAGFPGAYDCIKVFSETDHTDDLKKFDVPTLIIHGDDDQIVPIGASAMLSSKIVKGAILKVYPGAPHGLPSTLKDQVNEELFAFFRA